MKKKFICALAAMWLTSPLAFAQTKVIPAEPALAAGSQVDEPAPESSALNGELFYQLIVAEITVQEGEPGAGFALLLDAARKTNDAKLYLRATDIALQSRSGEAALQAAMAWKQAQPASPEPNRYVLQILIALNRISQTAPYLKAGVERVPAAERSQAIAAIPQAYARASDKKSAAAVVESALADYLADPATAASAWTTIGRMRIAAGDNVGALQAATQGQAAGGGAEGPVLVALELMDPTRPGAEAIVKNYLEGHPAAIPEIRMGYARGLLDAQRYADASAQLQIVTRQKPDFSAAWLVLGSLQLQDNQLALAQTSLERFVALDKLTPTADDAPNRGLAQAYLSLAQIAEKRKDFAGAEAWIAKIENAEDMMSAQTRRASLLANQGKLAEGLALIRNLPERNEGDARLKVLAETGLLRDLKRYQLAYDLLGEATAKLPNDTDLIYDRAMMAEKLGKLPEMEALLRRVMELKPDYYNAYNALGYSFAERNVRLPEARQLVQKALEYVPNDPFIKDSLGWVEFRMGNKAEANRIFTEAFKDKPDAEIAAHFGEVLWSMGQREKAMAIWREGQLLNPENETLLETFKRLQVKP